VPLRDHFRSPVNDLHSWDGLHGMWPAMMVVQLRKTLPKGYLAAPQIHLGSGFEVDVAAIEILDHPQYPNGDRGSHSTLLMPNPSRSISVNSTSQDEYEVRIYDSTRGRKLVAAIEIVSPSNKDRPENRRAFVAKVASLLRQEVSVSIVDVITIRSGNLVAEVLTHFGTSEPTADIEGTGLSAVTLRARRESLDLWEFPLQIGKPLPLLPVWLSDDLGIPLDLEACYEEACSGLGIE
jgi:Protein of unknown function (DUF4058)